jgi:hypothetical protein
VTRHRPESSAVNSTASNQNLRSFVLELAHYDAPMFVKHLNWGI